jgi:hypothetical protein
MSNIDKELDDLVSAGEAAMASEERWASGGINSVTAYERRAEAGRVYTVPLAFGSGPAALADAIREFGSAVCYRDGWPGGQGGPHFDGFNPARSRDHLDAFFCEVGWSGAADAENGDHSWWKRVKRQSAAEEYFGVPAGSLP